MGTTTIIITALYDLYVALKKAEAANIRVWFTSDFRRSGTNTRLVIGDVNYEWHTDTIKQEDKLRGEYLALNAFSRKMWVRATDNGFTVQEVLNTILVFENENSERKYAIDEMLADLESDATTTGTVHADKNNQPQTMTQTPHNHLLNAHSITALYQQLVSLYNDTDFEHYSHIKTKQKDDYTDYCFYVTAGNSKSLYTVIRFASSILTPALVPYAQVWHEDALEELIAAIKRSGAVDAILSRADLIDNALAELA